MKLAGLRKIFILLIISVFYILVLNFTSNDVSYSASGGKDVVYVSPYVGDYKTLKDGLNAVNDGGTIYVKYYHQSYYFEDIVVNKNIKIIGIPSGINIPRITCKLENNIPFIMVKEPYSLQIENLYIQSVTSKKLIESNTSNLSLKNIYLKYGQPIIINSPANSSNLNISFDKCIFDGMPPKVILNTPVNGNILFNNCNFVRDSIIIKNSGANIDISNSIFEQRGIKIEKYSYGRINVSNNNFVGNNALIDSYSSSDIVLSYNKFPSSGVIIYTHDDTKLDANNNWWGSPDGPSPSIRNSIVCDRWACDEAFTVFNDTPSPPGDGGGVSDETEEPKEPDVPKEDDPKTPTEPSEPEEDIPTEPEDPEDKNPEHPENPPEQEEPEAPTEPVDGEEPVAPEEPGIIEEPEVPVVPIIPDIPPIPTAPQIPEDKDSKDYNVEPYDDEVTMPKGKITIFDLNTATAAIRIDDEAITSIICESLKDGKGHWLFNCYIIYHSDGSLLIYILGDNYFVI